MSSALKMYFEARKAYNQAIDNVVNNQQVVEDIKKKFEEQHPGYYINSISAVTGLISATVHRKVDNRIVEAMVFPKSDGTWDFKH